MWKKPQTSTILTWVGAVGVVATSVLTAKSTFKAALILEQEKCERGGELTMTESIKIAWPAYIPPVMMGAATITCIFGANILNQRTQASLMSAYALLNNSYKDYKEKVKELYGEDADAKVKEAIALETIDEVEKPKEDDVELFFDFNALRYFEGKMSDVVHKAVSDDGMECWIISTPFDAYSDYGFL